MRLVIETNLERKVSSALTFPPTVEPVRPALLGRPLFAISLYAHHLKAIITGADAFEYDFLVDMANDNALQF